MRLPPALFVLCIVAWLDRGNVGFAGLRINPALGFNASLHISQGVGRPAGVPLRAAQRSAKANGPSRAARG